VIPKEACDALNFTIAVRRADPDHHLNRPFQSLLRHALLSRAYKDAFQNEARAITGITDVNLLTTEVTHVANRRDRIAGIASSGKFAGVAVQHRLGILPKWRIRFSPGCPHYSCSNGQDLSPADEVEAFDILGHAS
jgi:hypothetical protein